MNKVSSFLLGLIAILGNSPATAQRMPSGYYVMQEVGSQNVKDTKLQSPVFSGIVIRERWSSIAPTRNTFNWAFLDSQVLRARKYGKQYILSIYTGNNAPLWLNVPLFRSAPLPWDPVMLASHGQMVAALGARYSSDPLLVGVELSGPTRGPNGSLEMMLADGLERQSGYSVQRMIAAWRQCADQYAAAFPRCGLISDGGVAPDGNDGSITTGLWNYMATAYPRQANFSHCSLRANMSEDSMSHQLVVNMARRGYRVGFEMLCPSVAGVNGENGPVPRFGGPFKDALSIADRAGASWLKIYQGDEYNAQRATFQF